MKLAWSLGAGAKLGDGRQRMPMISLEDYLGSCSGRPRPRTPPARTT